MMGWRYGWGKGVVRCLSLSLTRVPRSHAPTLPLRTFPSWWETYSDRKNDEADEHVADSLLYDRNHLPRSAPAPDCVPRRAGGAGGGGGGGGAARAGPATPAPGEE